METNSKGSSFANFRTLTLRYVGALALVALLSTSAFILLNTLLASQEGDAPQINVSGRQRMLSQRIAMMSLRLANATQGSEEYNKAKKLLADAVELMESSHQALVSGDEELGISSKLAANLQDHYFGAVGLDAKVEEFLARARQLVEHTENSDSGSQDELAYIVAAAQKPLIADLNAAVKLYEENSKLGASRMHTAELFIWLATLGLLVAECMFIFRPMTRTICRQFSELEESNRNLISKDQRIQLLLNSTQDGFLPLTLYRTHRDLRQRDDQDIHPKPHFTA